MGMSRLEVGRVMQWGWMGRVMRGGGGVCQRRDYERPAQIQLQGGHHTSVQSIRSWVRNTADSQSVLDVPVTTRCLSRTSLTGHFTTINRLPCHCSIRKKQKSTNQNNSFATSLCRSKRIFHGNQTSSHSRGYRRHSPARMTSRSGHVGNKLGINSAARKKLSVD